MIYTPPARTAAVTATHIKPRSLRIESVEAGRSRVRLTVGGEDFVYTVDRVTCGWLWVQFGHEDGYLVTTGGCCCDGFRYRGTCKHYAATLRLIRLGRQPK